MSLTLDELVAGMPDDVAAPRTAKIDVSRFFGQEPETTVFEFEELSIAARYAIGDDARRIQRKYHEWPELMCRTIATLALAHRSPVPAKGSVGEQYCKLIEKVPALLPYLDLKFTMSFPDDLSLDAMAEQAKNG